MFGTHRQKNFSTSKALEETSVQVKNKIDIHEKRTTTAEFSAQVVAFNCYNISIETYEHIKEWNYGYVN